MPPSHSGGKPELAPAKSSSLSDLATKEIHSPMSPKVQFSSHIGALGHILQLRPDRWENGEVI